MPAPPLSWLTVATSVVPHLLLAAQHFLLAVLQLLDLASITVCHAGAGCHRLPEIRCAGKSACNPHHDTRPTSHLIIASLSDKAGRQQQVLRAQSAAMFESRFNSVERIMAYNQLAQEAPATIEATQCAVVIEGH